MASIIGVIFLPMQSSSIISIAPTEWRYGNVSEINPMVDLAARSRRIFY